MSFSTRNNRENRAVAQFACPTCKARPGHPCTGKDGAPMVPMHGPACHPLRRKLLTLSGIEETK